MTTPTQTKKIKSRQISWEERKKIIRFYDLRRVKRRKELSLIVAQSIMGLKRIGMFFMELLSWLTFIFISVMVGYASEPIIYILNKPLGLGYAHFASYTLTALTFYLLKEGTKK